MAAIGPEGVMERYGSLINEHRFEVLLPLIAPDAVFWFNDGSHAGITAIAQAFESVWAVLRDESYWLEDLHWLARDDRAAACIYRFCWTATINGRAASGSGRGTTVLQCRAQAWQIVHEHLSAAPG
ncbi:YybH family protein [Devosia beringensis]|uniref:YybH family protein n=1 Tax=Devosia beringensis TaxID=2657486 RepID=UPI00186B70E5|nr:nuclear transport factor 2 family protein [Devosia beringensis]